MDMGSGRKAKTRRYAKSTSNQPHAFRAVNFIHSGICRAGWRQFKSVRLHGAPRFEGPRKGVWCLRLSYLVISLHWKFRSTRRWVCQTHFGIVPRNVSNRSRLTVIRLDLLAMLEMPRERASPCGIAAILWNSQGVMPLLQWCNDVVKLAFEARVYDTRPQNVRAWLHCDEQRICFHTQPLFIPPYPLYPF
jgi:hypothetical protein